MPLDRTGLEDRCGSEGTAAEPGRTALPGAARLSLAGGELADRELSELLGMFSEHCTTASLLGIDRRGRGRWNERYFALLSR